MALVNENEINSLVLGYLLKICPKSAKIFAKSTKSKPLTPGKPSLQELLNQSSMTASVPEVAKSSSQKQQVSSQALQKQDSSSEESSSDSESEAKPNVASKPNNWTSAISKFAEMSDSSSESEDEMISLVKKPTVNSNIGKSSPQACKKSSSKNASSSDSSSESEPDVKPNNSQKVVIPVNKTLKGIAVNKALTQKNDSSSSDSSSDSDEGVTAKSVVEEKKAVVKPAVLPSQIQKKGLAPKKQVSSSDDSSSDSESTTNSKIKSIVPKVNTPLPKAPLKSKGASLGKVTTSIIKGESAKEADSSSDSSSDEEMQNSLSKKAILKNAVGKTSVLNDKKSLSKSDSTSDSSSESEAETKPRQSLKKGVLTSEVSKLATANKSVKNKDSSSSDSSSDSDKKALAKAKPTVTPSQTPKKVMTPKKQVSSTDDSSSDSESASKPTNVKSPGHKVTTPMSKTPSKSSDASLVKATASFVKGKKETDSSSDSSSDEEMKESIQKKNTLSKGKVTDLPLTKKNNSSSSDSEEEQPKNKGPILNPNVASQKGKTLVNKKPHTQTQNQESSSSDDSSSEEETSTPASTLVKSNLSSPVGVNTPLAKKPVTPGKIISSLNGKKSISGISSIQKKASSSSDSSSDSETKKPTLTPVAKNQTNKSSDSSDSSDSDDSMKTPKVQTNNSDTNPVKKMKPTTVKNTSMLAQKKSSSSSSDDDSENVEKPKAFHSLKRKHGGSTESSSDSDGESELHTPNQLPTQPQKKQKLNNSHSNLNVSENTPITSDSTKKRRGSSPFRRIKDENFVIDQRLRKSSAEAKHFIPSLGASKGKQFRHEKTKKKRNNSAGKIDLSVNSIKFE